MRGTRNWKGSRRVLWAAGCCSFALVLLWLASGWVSVVWRSDGGTAGVVLLRGIVSYRLNDAVDLIPPLVRHQTGQLFFTHRFAAQLLPDWGYYWRFVHRHRGSRTIG